MKIAIITHSLRYNYGGILQNYAMQQVLKKMGHCTCTLKIFRTFPFSIIEHLKYYVKRMIRRPCESIMSRRKMNIICQNTDKFIDSYIEMSPVMNYIDRDWVKSQKFDAFIVGSDQVLHPSSYRYIEDVYLWFISQGKKIMYAASFGGEEWKYSTEKEQICSVYIKKFLAVSVRENVGVKLMKEKFNIDADLVLDPTLLLDKEDYLKFVTHIHSRNKIATYILDPTSEKDKFISICSQELNKKVISAGNCLMDDPTIKSNDRIAPSVEEWLERMYYADYVITDSYHGTLFSIIFHKKFLTIGNPKRGMDRFYTILNALGLESRLILDYNQKSMSILDQEIDYTRIDDIICVLRLKSMNFLSNNLAR